MKPTRNIRLFIVSLVLSVAGGLCIANFSGCATSPATQATEVRTLLMIGTTAKAGINTAAQLLAGGKITVEQYQKVATFYDLRFQPVFNLAVTAARSDLSSIASPDVVSLAAQFALLVGELTTKPAASVRVTFIDPSTHS